MIISHLFSWRLEEKRSQLSFRVHKRYRISISYSPSNNSLSFPPPPKKLIKAELWKPRPTLLPELHAKAVPTPNFATLLSTKTKSKLQDLSGLKKLMPPSCNQIGTRLASKEQSDHTLTEQRFCHNTLGNISWCECFFVCS